MFGKHSRRFTSSKGIIPPNKSNKRFKTHIVVNLVGRINLTRKLDLSYIIKGSITLCLFFNYFLIFLGTICLISYFNENFFLGLISFLIFKAHKEDTTCPRFNLLYGYVMQTKDTQERQQTQQHKIMSNKDCLEALVQSYITRYFLFKWSPKIQAK
jgi:hypothetical protein